MRPQYLRRYSESVRFGRSGDRIPECARFSAPGQTDPGAQPTSCTMNTASFPEGKRQGRSVDLPQPTSVEVTDRLDLNQYFPLRLRGLT